jgi:D-alanine--poly(phosphoribitol) ligase subunit 1
VAVQKNVLEYLEASARKRPHKIALVDEKNEMTYAVLMRNAQRIGTMIAKEIQCTNAPVAVITGRRISTPEAFFGVLYSGNYYVPVDYATPRNRLEKMFRKLNPALILYDPEDERLAGEFYDRYPLLCTEKKTLYPPEISLLTRCRQAVLDIDPAYVIFTSGSTGIPKGIVITHRGIIDLTEWLTDTLGYDENDVFGNQAPFFFDGSVKDIYATIKMGATLHVLPKKLFREPLLLMEALNKKKITVIQWATSAFHLAASSGALLKDRPQFLRIVAAAGESMKARYLNVWRKALPNATFVNLYGPAEVSVDCSYYIIDREFLDQEPVPIGVPCANKEILLLDNTLRPVQDGEPGEICVRGLGLAKGYFNDPEKTEVAFVQNPKNPYFPDLIYRTGDIAVKNGDGQLVFQCRKDDQIKHQGYRVELGEVERAVNCFQKIREAFCFYNQEEDQIICLYEGEMEVSEILSYLQDFLPAYMFPDVFYPMKMRYNPNGKIDRIHMQEAYYREHKANTAQ